MDRAKVERWWRQVISGGNTGISGHATRGMLYAGSLPFDAVARLRAVLYDVRILPVLKLPVPVVSFGNLTVGGTGKTPAVIWAARRLAHMGLNPGIASRGYNPGGDGPEGPNDEAALIAETLPGVPHLWNSDRARAGAALVKEHGCGAVILDDGFQHRRLHRTLDFLLIDALEPFGYGHMLPRGLLREPVSALKRASAVIITRANLVSRDQMAALLAAIRAVDPGVRLAEALHKPSGVHFATGGSEDPAWLSGKKVFAFAGIGNPHAFVMTLSHLGAKVVGLRAFEDHHAYSAAEIDAVFRDAAAHGADVVITTQKDRVKTGWREGSQVPLAELRVEFELTRGRDAVESALEFLVSSAPAGRVA